MVDHSSSFRINSEQLGDSRKFGNAFGTYKINVDTTKKPRKNQRTHDILFQSTALEGCEGCRDSTIMLRLGQMDSALRRENRARENGHGVHAARTHLKRVKTRIPMES
jgi:hypothetical protein